MQENKAIMEEKPLWMHLSPLTQSLIKMAFQEGILLEEDVKDGQTSNSSVSE